MSINLVETFYLADEITQADVDDRKPLNDSRKITLRKRVVVETINDLLKNGRQVEHPRTLKKDRLSRTDVKIFNFAESFSGLAATNPERLNSTWQSVPKERGETVGNQKSFIMKTKNYLLLLVFFAQFLFVNGQRRQAMLNQPHFSTGNLWFDTDGKLINAHGGGVLYHEGKYYWFGEHKSENSNAAFVGVTCYSSADLYGWKNEGIALSVSDDESSPIVRGCTIERPKVIHNAKTGKFVMYFHLELKGLGYGAAQVAVAVSDELTGPYRLIKNSRVNAGKWPLDMNEEQRLSPVQPDDFKEWWTPQWREAVKDGLFVRRDFAGGQMSRDMTLFVDDDGKAYHIYSSEENLTLHIAELTDDYMDYTGRYIRVEPGGHNEAPALFKKEGRYFMITSGCTGWEPNAARLLTANEIMGQWTLHPNPCKGEDADLTFHSQSTFILPVQGRNDTFIFMADRWRPRNPIDGRYVWLPILFENGLPTLKWVEKWNLDIFDGAN